MGVVENKQQGGGESGGPEAKLFGTGGTRGRRVSRAGLAGALKLLVDVAGARSRALRSRLSIRAR